jgi:hypothetical protein
MIFGSHTDVVLHNTLIVAETANQSSVCVELPDIGTGVVDLWLPEDSRCTFNPIVPPSWPPVAGDLWSAPGTAEAWVVAGPDATLYFVTPTNVLNAYTGNTTLPSTVSDALAAYGNALTLLYRHP